MADEEETAATLVEWLDRHGWRALSVRRLVGDVSSRSYWRAQIEGESKTWIVAHYPREMASAQQRFAAAGELLRAGGVRVPELRLDDPDSGLALIEDMGPATLYETAAGGWASAPRELAAAVRAAQSIARLDPAEVVALRSPALDAELLRRELAKTWDLLLAPAGVDEPELIVALDSLCERLARALVPCHRDFMARNLMPIGTDAIGVLDYQDLRLGPVGYDLASLLNDSLFASASLEARLVAATPDLAGPPEQYRAAVIQRSLKAVGTYLGFARRGMRRHLPLVGSTLERALRFFPEVAETSSLGRSTIEALRRAGSVAAVC